VSSISAFVVSMSASALILLLYLLHSFIYSATTILQPGKPSNSAEDSGVHDRDGALGAVNKRGFAIRLILPLARIAQRGLRPEVKTRGPTGRDAGERPFMGDYSYR